MPLPLEHICVLDLIEGPLAPISRIYADLGARVTRPGTLALAHRQQSPIADLRAEIGNLGKAPLPINDASGEDPAWFASVVAAADLVLTDGRALDQLRAEATRRPSLVVLVATMFGSGNAYSDWQATDAVLHALSSGLSRSGIRGREPLLPPGTIALNCAIMQAAYAGIAALHEARATGLGDWIDYAALEGAVQALDPGFGSSGVAATGRTADQLSRDRPSKGFRYPIFRCADGQVRICLLSPRQWQGMFRWMGEPPAFAGDEFNATARRYQSRELTEALAAFFAPRAKDALELEAAKAGVPLSIMRRFEDCVASDHLRDRGALTRVALSSGRSAVIPNGIVEIDGVRAGPHVERSGVPGASGTASAAVGPPRPLSRLKVLDLGVIVVGAEQSRLLADLGADVVKVETSAFPDGSRQSIDGSMSASFAAGHRNKRSVGLNLRHEVGRELFLKLAAKADVMFSNFKPGTLEALGIDRATLAKANPGIVTVESSAFGAAGPWSARLGYGPLVRAAAGLSEAWRYPTDPDSYSDSITVYPDHVAGRVGAIAALALLLRRQWLGQGGEAKISQMEVMLDQFSAEIAATGLAEPELAGPEDAPWGVYRAAGDDEWCVVTVRNDADWASLATVVGYADPHLKSRSGRLAAREQLEAVLSDWISSRSAQSAMEVLQAAGVPAARMLRASDLPDFGFFKARRFFVAMEHPKVAQDLIVERGPFCGERLGDAPQRPAPSMGEHTVEVMRDWLGADEAAIAAWVDKGALQLGAT